jgi:hypothetical protein
MAAPPYLPEVGEETPPRHTSRAKPPVREEMTLGVERGPMKNGNTGHAPSPSPMRGRPKAKPKTKPKDAPPPERRFLVAEIVGHAKDEPLALKKQLLEVSVELENAGDAATPLPDASLTHAESEDSITRTIQVTSEDFDVSQKKGLPLELPRRGPSDGKARFDVKPKKAGRGTLTISVHKDGNFLLQMELAYSIGATTAAAAAPVEQKVHGRNLTSASQLKKRDLGFTIKPVTGGYECVDGNQPNPLGDCQHVGRAQGKSLRVPICATKGSNRNAVCLSSLCDGHGIAIASYE